MTAILMPCLVTQVLVVALMYSGPLSPRLTQGLLLSKTNLSCGPFA